MRYIPPMAPHHDDWSTRHSVLTTARRTAALLNVLAADRPAATDVAAVLRAYGEAEPFDLTAGDVARMRTAGALLRPVFAAEHADAAAATLNRLLRDHAGPLRLTSHGGSTPWHPHLDRDDDAPWDVWFIASSCMALGGRRWGPPPPPPPGGARGGGGFVGWGSERGRGAGPGG
ncbi:CGNR zinc finger domain-containing protein [Streptomyces sp. HSW2009]|uniref:CGNR zinc finger domain-containing protein n=1 Tax=Streptomyces sp. HSW2009 TaxID=3142890 RepID=UPI0032EE7424